GTEQGAVESLLPLVGSSVGGSLADQLIRTAVYGPVRTVVWEGAGREACPYPDFYRRRPSFKRASRGA
ncbi:hypothetical protein, partial [Paraburkholderia elongata]|uniref:hypothetical protein n=1 Tax=Paraburkholderia elongata TaxID=2675747 RepID=UPI001C1316A5